MTFEGTGPDGSGNGLPADAKGTEFMFLQHMAADVTSEESVLQSGQLESKSLLFPLNIVTRIYILSLKSHIIVFQMHQRLNKLQEFILGLKKSTIVVVYASVMVLLRSHFKTNSYLPSHEHSFNLYVWYYTNCDLKKKLDSYLFSYKKRLILRFFLQRLIYFILCMVNLFK